MICLGSAGFANSHFLPRARTQRDTISARGRLQRCERVIGSRFSEVGPVWFFDESPQARQ
jgi:hypothetical protein